MPDTLSIDAPVAGLPVGPATEGSVRKQLRIEDTMDDDALELAINAVNQVVVEFAYPAKWIESVRPADDPPPEDWGIEWPHRIVQGATMLAARVFGRRNSVEGVAAFGQDGAVYVVRNDPDVALMLKLGGNREPAVG